MKTKQQEMKHPDYSLNDPNKFNRHPFVDKETEERCKAEAEKIEAEFKRMNPFLPKPIMSKDFIRKQTGEGNAPRFSPKWFDNTFTDPVSGEPYAIPANLRKVSERICRSYDIGGLCDPMYIANVIAFELGLGDGYSNFKKA